VITFQSVVARRLQRSVLWGSPRQTHAKHLSPFPSSVPDGESPSCSNVPPTFGCSPIRGLAHLASVTVRSPSGILLHRALRHLPLKAAEQDCETQDRPKIPCSIETE